MPLYFVWWGYTVCKVICFRFDKSDNFVDLYCIDCYQKGLGIYLMFRRLLITAVLTAIFGCALAIVSCGDSGTGAKEPLRWRTAIDVPVNFSLPVGQDLDTMSLFPKVPGCEDLKPYDSLLSLFNCDSLTPEQDSVIDEIRKSLISELPTDTSFLVDLGTDTVSTGSDVTDFLGKLTETNIKYSVTVTNRTKVDLTFYGMFFRKDDAIARDSIDVYYNKILEDSTRGGRVNVFPPNEKIMQVNAKGDTGSYTCTSTVVGKSLADLIINKKAFSWRWLVRLKPNDYGDLGNNAKSADSVDIKLKIHFSGVNSIDSLFTL